MSFADLSARLLPAVVNISTKQRVPVKAQSDPFEEFFRRFDPNQSQGGTDNSGGAQPRTREAGSLGSGFIISPDGYVVVGAHERIAAVETPLLRLDDSLQIFRKSTSAR